jgi:hypothetical protein
MPAPIVAVPIGIGASLVLEAVLSGGKASKRDYVVAGAVGAVPVGVGIGQIPRLLQKGGHVVRYGATKPGTKNFVLDSTAYFTPELAMLAGGVVVGAGAGRVYDMHTGYQGTVTPGRGVITSQPSRKPARSGKIGRRRKRCTHKDSRGRRCLRPAGHSGRHRYV